MLRLLGCLALGEFPLSHVLPFRKVGSSGLVKEAAWFEDQSIDSLHFKGFQLANVMSSLFIDKKV